MSPKEELVRRFREIQPKFSRLYARILTRHRLTLPQYALLSQLVQEGTLSMTQASRRLHITKPAITNLVDRLEKNKCLRRLPHAKDRRSYLLQIESKGEKIVREIQTRVLGILLKTVEEFGPQERKVIAQFYVQLSQTIDQELTYRRRKPE